MTQISATTARKEFAETLNRVAYTGERVILERSGKRIAAIIPLEDLELLQELEDRMDLAAIRKALKGPKRPWSEVKADLDL